MLIKIIIAGVLALIGLPLLYLMRRNLLMFLVCFAMVFLAGLVLLGLYAQQHPTNLWHP